MDMTGSPAVYKNRKRVFDVKKLLSLALAAALAVTCLSGCSGSGGTAPSTGAPQTSTPESGAPETPAANSDLVVDLSDISVGACVMSLRHEFMANLVVGYKEFMAQTNCNVIITDGGNMEPEKQVTNVENYIAQNVDGILCQCISVETMKDTLKHAMDAGIPVGIYPYDTSVGATTYFGYNEYDWGYSLGENAADWINSKLDGSAKILNVITTLEEAAVQRSQGWQDAIKALCDESKLEWVTVEATSSEDAMATTESALQANPDVDMVLVYNDEMGIGAYQAIVQSGLDTTNMYLGSCDGTDTVLDYVQEDTVYRCTVGNDRFVSEIGFYWVENMVKIALGMDYDDPFPITTIAITKDNVDDYRSREPEYVISQDLIDFVNNM
mgnify:FL=1